jgi:hypothetical protein
MLDPEMVAVHLAGLSLSLGDHGPRRLGESLKQTSSIPPRQKTRNSPSRPAGVVTRRPSCYLRNREEPDPQAQHPQAPKREPMASACEPVPLRAGAVVGAAHCWRPAAWSLQKVALLPSRRPAGSVPLDHQPTFGLTSTTGTPQGGNQR